VANPVPGLYEQLVTEELTRLLAALDPDRVAVEGADTADAHLAVAEHLRRILERALRAIPEDDRATRQAELCNAVLSRLRQGPAVESVGPGESLTVPLAVLREIKALDRGAAFSQSTTRPLVPLSAADLLGVLGIVRNAE